MQGWPLVAKSTYIKKPVRRALDDMIVHVCSAPAGSRYAGVELTVEHEDGDEDNVTIIVLSGRHVDFLGMNVAAKTGVEVPHTIDEIKWEGSD